MQIGGSQYASSLVATQSQTSAANRAQRRKLGFQVAEEDNGPKLTKSQPEPVKIGFGSDSVKIPSLAVATIKQNVRQAEVLIPTLEESQARVHERVQEDQRRLTEQKQEPPQTLDFRAAQSSAANSARAYLSSINAAAGEARFRTGVGDEAQTNRLDVRIGDTVIPLEKTESRPPIDLFA